jgi:hypothetical protein
MRVCTPVLCSLATVLSCIDPSVRIVTKSPKGRTSTCILWFTGVRGEGREGEGPAAAPDAGVQCGVAPGLHLLHHRQD